MHKRILLCTVNGGQDALMLVQDVCASNQFSSSLNSLKHELLK